MSPVYRPEKYPPKLDRFCYLSHPAQRVMAALYNDYITRKRDILECQALKSSASENYYTSIYKSRFGSAPTESSAKSTCDQHPNKMADGLNSGRSDALYTINEITVKEYPTNNQPDLQHTKYSNTEPSGHIAWISSDTSTYSDSPPIETQGYRILSQFQQGDFTDTLDTETTNSRFDQNSISNGTYFTPSNIISVGEFDNTGSFMSENAAVNFSNPTFGTIERSTINSLNDSFDSCNRKSFNIKKQSTRQTKADSTEDLTVKTHLNESSMHEKKDDFVCQGIDGSQSLFSQDEERSMTDGYIPKRHRTGNKTKKCARMQQLHGGLGEMDNQDSGRNSNDVDTCLIFDFVDQGIPNSELNKEKSDRSKLHHDISICNERPVFSPVRIDTPIYNESNFDVRSVYSDSPEKVDMPVCNEGNFDVRPVYTPEMIDIPISYKGDFDIRPVYTPERIDIPISNKGDFDIRPVYTPERIDIPISNKGDFDIRPVYTPKRIVTPISNKGDFDIRPVFTPERIDIQICNKDIRPVRYPGKIDNQGDSDGHSYSSFFLDKTASSNHMKQSFNKPKQGGSLSLGDKLKQLNVGNYDKQEAVKTRNDEKCDIDRYTDKESPYLHKTTTVYYPIFSGKKLCLQTDASEKCPEKKLKVSEQKRKMSSSFAVPFKKPKVSNSSRPGVSNERCLIDIESLSEIELKTLLSQLLELDELVIILVNKDGSTQLRDNLFGQDSKRKSVNKVKQSTMELDCFAISSRCLEGKKVITFPVRLSSYLLRDFWCELLRNQSKKVGFHTKETLAAITQVYNLTFNKVDTSWTMFDPTVGLWLLDPDKPVSHFEGVLHALCLPEQVPSNDCLDVLYEDMMLLGIAVDKINQKLKSKDMWILYTCVETKLTSALMGMEMRTLHIATHTLIKSSEILKKKLKKLEQKAYEAAGHSFLINSHAQLRQVLFEELRLDARLPKKTKLAKTNVGREKSTSETVLTQLSPFHDLPGIILEYRQLQKLKSTYIDGILSCMKDETLYTHWDQTAAATGRLTSYHPNIQAIPKQPVNISGYQDNYIAGKEVNDEIEIYARDAFISRPGYSFVAADFQQIELRILAHLADDPVLLQSFTDTDNPDIFNVLTAQWLGKTVSEVSTSEREQTKRVVYSVMYGAGKEKLAEYLKISIENAKSIMLSFLTKFPSVSRFTKYCVEFCQKNGYTSSIFKRRRLFPNIKHPSPWLRAQAERQCVNFCIQGSAADICKAAMIQIENALAANDKLDAQLLVQIHDELLIEVADTDIPDMINVIQDVMQSQQKLCGTMVTLKVPTPVSISVGKTWGHMKVLGKAEERVNDLV